MTFMFRLAFVLSLFLHVALLLGPSVPEISGAVSQRGRASLQLALTAERYLPAKLSLNSRDPEVNVRKTIKGAPRESVSRLSGASPKRSPQPTVGKVERKISKLADKPGDSFSAEALLGAAEGVSNEGVRQYRLSLAHEARHERRYPDLAKMSHLQGVVVVQVSSPGGVHAPVVALGRSSGHAILDAAALSMMIEAVSRAVIPEGLKGRPFDLSLPVRYAMEE